MRNVISSIIHHLNCELLVDSVVSGLESIKKYKASCKSKAGYKLILMSIGMKDLDGLKTCAAIRAYEIKKRNTKCNIIGINIHCAEEERIKIASSYIGMNDVIYMPIPSETIKSIIANLLAHSKL